MARVSLPAQVLLSLPFFMDSVVMAASHPESSRNLIYKEIPTVAEKPSSQRTTKRTKRTPTREQVARTGNIPKFMATVASSYRRTSRILTS